MTSPKKCQRLTFEERKKIEEYLKLGLSQRKIAKLINRTQRTLNLEVKKNGGNRNYTAQAAQANYKNSIKIRNKENSLKLRKNFDIFYSKIQNLEYQIEIILDIIKEKEKKYDATNN